METAGYVAALFIGISLGLIGGGGSILTVPVLVYLFGISPAVGISYSLFVVGITSLVGAFNNYRKGLVNFKVALIFGVASISTVFITRKFIVPLILNKLFQIGSISVTYSLLVMLLFAVLMLAASISMIRSRKIAVDEKNISQQHDLLVFLYGIVIGLVTGFLGAGGGFLLIPALVILMKLPIKEAIGTSLLIIALNSLIGFVGDIGHYTISWKFLLTVSCIAIVGVFIGGFFNDKVNAEKLKKGFGWFVLVMGIYIIVKEIFL